MQYLIDERKGIDLSGMYSTFGECTRSFVHSSCWKNRVHYGSLRIQRFLRMRISVRRIDTDRGLPGNMKFIGRGVSFVLLPLMMRCRSFMFAFSVYLSDCVSFE
jgi:hypothetical protein